MITWSAVLVKCIPFFAKAGSYLISRLIKKAELKDNLDLQHLQTILDIYQGVHDSVDVSDQCAEMKKRLLARKAEIDAKKANTTNESPKQ
jgi:hypothetical protein